MKTPTNQQMIQDLVCVAESGQQLKDMMRVLGKCWAQHRPVVDTELPRGSLSMNKCKHCYVEFKPNPGIKPGMKEWEYCSSTCYDVAMEAEHHRAGYPGVPVKEMANSWQNSREAVAILELRPDHSLAIKIDPNKSGIFDDFIDANLAGPGKETVRVEWVVSEDRHKFTHLVLKEDNND